MSANFAALYKVMIGDVVTLSSSEGPVRLTVVGELVDYSWNKGTLILNRRDLVSWHDDLVHFFDVYLKNPDEANKVKDLISTKLGAQYGLQSLTRVELQQDIDETIEQLYGIAYAQQIVVMLVA